MTVSDVECTNKVCLTIFGFTNVTQRKYRFGGKIRRTKMNKKLLAAVLLVCLAVCLCFAACQPKEEPQEVVLTEIKVTTPPTKTTYEVGEKFDKTGMVITAVYSDKTEKAVTNYTYAPTDELGVSDKEIVISYTEKKVTKNATVTISVVEAIPDSLDAPVIALGDDSISSKDRRERRRYMPASLL